MRRSPVTLPLLTALALFAGAATTARAGTPVTKDYYGKLEPFASQSVYFVMTDRFVNGDPGNDHRQQGGKLRTFDIPLPPCNGCLLYTSRCV